MTHTHKKHYDQEGFFKHIDALIVRRDVTSRSAVTNTKSEQDELVDVKINQRISPVVIHKMAFISQYGQKAYNDLEDSAD